MTPLLFQVLRVVVMKRENVRGREVFILKISKLIHQISMLNETAPELWA